MFTMDVNCRIKVLLDDSYPAVKLLDKYEVVEREGDIFILDALEEKENE